MAFQLLKKDNRPNNNLQPDGEMDIKEATRMIQELMTDRENFEPEEIKLREDVLDSAMAGEPGADKMAVKFIQSVMERFGITVKGMDTCLAAYEIYKYAWGLDVIEELYKDPEVDEIRVNDKMITVQRRGKNEKTNVKFKDSEHVIKIITKLIRHDRGVALTGSTPCVESMRRDGTRITATCAPFTRMPTLVLRKHNTFKMNLDNLTRAGTLDEKVYAYLKLLVKGRANILISGGCGSGKTSLLRHLVSFMHPSLRIVVMENDVELRLAEHYPDRDIVEFEEHPELGLTLKKGFRTALRIHRM